MELSLIPFISLLVVCSAVLLFKKAARNETLSLVAAKFRPALIAIGAAVTTMAFALPTYAQHAVGKGAER